MENQKKIAELYNGDVQIQLKERNWGSRVIQSYEVVDNGEVVGKPDLLRVTDVTGVINKPALVNWAAKMACNHLRPIVSEGRMITMEDLDEAQAAHRNAAAKAAANGTLVHEWAENYIKYGKTDIDHLSGNEAALNGVKAFLKWVNEHNVEFVSSERRIYSRKEKFVGTMDAEAKVDGKLCVIDFKTSSGIYDEMLLQTAAYQGAAMEEGSKYDGDRIIVRFDKETGAFESHSYGNFRQDYATFKAALKLKRWLTKK